MKPALSRNCDAAAFPRPTSQAACLCLLFTAFEDEDDSPVTWETPLSDLSGGGFCLRFHVIFGSPQQPAWMEIES